ncbi:MAG: transglycosylase SLT domain-containing protein [Candidatus Zixiibacteriota bacterium]|nr:MAG: transglycosylase SLT domain-containing protein [candidate division Zixibacteria bacterium]
MSKDIFTDMFDMQMAQKMVTGDQRSISEILYQSLVKLIEAQFSDQEAPVKVKPLGAEKNDGIEIDRPDLEVRPGESESHEMKPKPDQFLPVSVRPSQPKNDAILSQFGRYIDKAAELTSLDPALIISVIRVESGGDPKAVSTAGAKGLMQLIDSTALDYGVTEVFDPEENITAGSRFLKDQLDRFGSLKLALAAYNAGPENVKRYGGVPPFEETERYVERVIDTLSTINKPVPNATAKAVKGTVDK